MLFLAAAVNAFAQPTYPKAPKPKPKASASASPSESPSTSPSADPSASATPKLPTGPLKMLTTDSVNPNKKSPIKFTEINFYDSGYGSKYNSEMRLSGAVLNTSKTDTLKKVTVKYQVVDNAGQLVQEWKESAPDLKPGATYRINPGVARNSLGTNLKGKMVVDHEEVPPKDGPKDGAK
jgi:hypothetical protein